MTQTWSYLSHWLLYLSCTLNQFRRRKHHRFYSFYWFYYLCLHTKVTFLLRWEMIVSFSCITFIVLISWNEVVLFFSLNGQILNIQPNFLFPGCTSIPKSWNLAFQIFNECLAFLFWFSQFLRLYALFLIIASELRLSLDWKYWPFDFVFILLVVTHILIIYSNNFISE